MSTRRSFLKQSGLALGALSLPSYAFSFNNYFNNGYEPGLQLYTIRDQMADNPQKSIEKVAKIGYTILEHATYSGSQKFYGLTASEMNALLKNNGVKMLSGHYALGDDKTPGTILNSWEQAVEDAHKVGLKYMVCPYLSPNERKAIDYYKKCAEEFNKAGEICKSAGIQFCYHNHNFEFGQVDGKLPYKILLQETDAELVKMQLDIFWVYRAGYDPIVLFDQNPGRYALWHVKDMARIEDNGTSEGGGSAITEVGNGVIDWPSVFAHAKKAGMENFFVEQDNAPKNPFPSITSSLTYLKNNIL